MLIPASAHGTNAASAALAGMRVVVVATADDGEILLDDLRAKLDQHGPQVAAIMITYPSTHGVYEEDVRRSATWCTTPAARCTSTARTSTRWSASPGPGEFGGDVSHLNLHKTFCIPHGGGGPGVGPVAVARAPRAVPAGRPDAGARPRRRCPAGIPVASTRYGSAGILPISCAYVALMGAGRADRGDQGRRPDRELRGAPARPTTSPCCTPARTGWWRTSASSTCATITTETGVTAEDVSKRLMDYGFHAPTLAFPVPGTLMVEPTESEDLAELDRFIDAMVAIRGEIDAVAAGRWAVADSPLRGAPHTAASVVDGRRGTSPYSRELAAFPRGRAAGRQVLAAGAPHRRGQRRPQPRLLVPAGRGVRRVSRAEPP